MEDKGKNSIIELLDCPMGGQTCSDQLEEMNSNLALAREYFLSKEYQHGFNVLKRAYNSTFVLQNDPCKKCAQFFREVIIGSFEQTTAELKKMSSGIFRRRKYAADYQLAQNVLNELRKRNR